MYVAAPFVATDNTPGARSFVEKARAEEAETRQYQTMSSHITTP